MACLRNIIDDFKLFVRINLLSPKGKYAFLKKIKPKGMILDVGCGNNSPYLIKKNFPGLHYTGVDISDYNQTQEILADVYLKTSPENFAHEISQFDECFDAVISSHNLEHCLERKKTLEAMLASVKQEGMLYLAFPCEKSTGFPSREGTLNYFDDKTHQYDPPNFDDVVAAIIRYGFDILFKTRQYRPFIQRFRGFLNEPRSKRKNRILPGTWEYYGFETIIWAKKRGSPGL